MTPEQLKRFEAKYVVDTETGCWLWTAMLDSCGYGRLRVGRAMDKPGRMVASHRLSYEHFKGPIPDGLEIDHLCRVRSCCNPDHLEAVTHAENKLRSAGYNRRAVCQRGHALTDDNVRPTQRGRKCLTCCREREKLRTQARAAARAAEPTTASWQTEEA